MYNRKASFSAFGDLRVSNVTPITGWKFNYNINSDMIVTTLTGAGGVTQSNSKAVLSTGASTSSSAKIETVYPLRYIPGVGNLVRFTAVFSAGVAGSQQLIGIGDSNDGLFLGYNGTNFGVLRRSGGVDNWTYSENFSGALGDESLWFDEMDAINYQVGNVYEIAFQWLGYGSQFYSVEYASTGTMELVHHEKYSNQHTEVSFLNPTLPIMAMVINTTNNTDITLETPSSIGAIEGSSSVFGRDPFSLFRNLVSNKSSVSTETNILTIKNLATWQSVNNRIIVDPKVLSLAVDGTKNAIVRVIKNATLGGSPSYANYNADTSPVQYDTAGTTVTGGTVLYSTVLSKVDSLQLDIGSLQWPIRAGDTLTISVASALSTDVDLSFGWNELH